MNAPSMSFDDAPSSWRTTERLERALADAARLHRQQVRKVSGVPFVAHPLAVCALVIESGGDEDTAIAALLHDAIEDAGGDHARQQIAETYGPRVARIVEDCTESDAEPKPPWRERKEAYLAHLAISPPDALLVALADKVCNTRTLIVDVRRLGPVAWQSFKSDPASQMWWHVSLLEAFTSRRAELGALALPALGEFEALVAELVSRHRTGADAAGNAHLFEPGFGSDE